MNQLPAEAQPDPNDLEQLNILGIFHYITGGLLLLFSCISIIYIVVGLLMALSPDSMNPHHANRPNPQMETAMGFVFAGIGTCMLLAGWTVGGLIIYSGRCLRAHRRRMFSTIVAGLCCLFVPIGTALGVFTIIVLQRDSVRQLYGE